MNENATPRAGRTEWIGLSVLALACLLYAMDLTVLHLAVPSLSASLQPSSAQLLWIIDIYGFLVAGALITMGNLGDRIGRRRLLMIGAAGFGAVSVLAAFSPSAETLIASRALMGLAGATLAPSTLSLIFTMFRDPKQRSVAIGVWIAAFSAGSAVGPVLGGLLLEHFWWGSVFLLALPVMGVLLVLGPRVLPEYRDPDAASLDLPSAALSLAALLGMIYGLKEITQSGVGPVPVAVGLAGLALGALFVGRQRRIDDPLIDLALFRSAVFTTALSISLIGIFVFVGAFLFVAQYLQLVLGLTPLQAGLWSVPSAAAFVAGSQIGPRLVHRFRPAVILGTALLVAAAGLLMLTRVGSSGGLATIVTGSVVIALALAPAFGLTTELVVGSAPPERAGAASGISETGFELGGALGIAILGSIGAGIYRSRLAADLPTGLSADVVATARDTLGGAVAVARDLPGDLGSTVVAAAHGAFAAGMRSAAAIGAIIALAAAAMCWVVLRDVPAGVSGGHGAPTPEPDVPVDRGDVDGLVPRPGEA